MGGISDVPANPLVQKQHPMHTAGLGYGRDTTWRLLSHSWRYGSVVNNNTPASSNHLTLSTFDPLPALPAHSHRHSHPTSPSTIPPKTPQSPPPASAQPSTHSPHPAVDPT
ncbi:hypothetical protein BST61_g9960 [Cercospora zeina]